MHDFKEVKQMWSAEYICLNLFIFISLLPVHKILLVRNSVRNYFRLMGDSELNHDGVM